MRNYKLNGDIYINHKDLLKEIKEIKDGILNEKDITDNNKFIAANCFNTISQIIRLLEEN